MGTRKRTLTTLRTIIPSRTKAFALFVSTTNEKFLRRVPYATCCKLLKDYRGGSIVGRNLSTTTTNCTSIDWKNNHRDNSKKEPLVSFYVNHNQEDNDNTNFMTSYLSGYSTSSSKDKNILRGKIGTITLNSPSTYNALTNEMGIEFQAICQQIRSEVTNSYTNNCNIYNAQNVQAIVLTGCTKQAFSAGGNISWLKSLHSNTIHENVDGMQTFYKYYHELRTIPVPIIAAINGPAMGAGACLALLCDLRTGAYKTGTKLGMHFSRLGIHAGMGGSYLLKSALGGPNAILNEVLLLGKILDCNECYEYNILNRVHDTDALIPAYELATEIVTKTHPVAVRTMLQTLRSNDDQQLKSTLQLESYLQAVCYSQKDWGEGLQALTERRDPIFNPYHSNSPVGSVNGSKEEIDSDNSDSKKEE